MAVYQYNQIQMGPSASKNREPPTSNQEECIFSHPRFKNSKIITPPNEEDDGVLEIGIAMPGQNQFKKWESKLDELGKYKELETIFLPISSKFQKTQFCGSGGTAWIQYKNYPYLLSDEINNRSNMDSKYFEESELWYLVYSMINATQTFHSKGLKTGDVRPENVFISHEGQVRVATQLTWPNETTNYFKTIYDKQCTYLAPEQLRDINYGKLDEGSIAQLSEAFSVGLTCYDAAALSNSTKLYQSGNKFNYSLLEQRLSALEQSRRYSEPLILLIKGLCHVESTKRISCSQVANWLDRYEQFINELQSFQFSEIPQKLLSLKPQTTIKNNGGPQYFQSNQPRSGVVEIVQNPRQVVVNPPNQQGYYSGSVPLIQSLYGDIGNNNTNGQQNVNFVGGKLQNQPINTAALVQKRSNTYVQNNPQAVASVTQKVSNVYRPSAPLQSNVYPSVITFQKDTQSGISDGSEHVQPIRGLNLNQIDEQLELSRKMFPS